MGSPVLALSAASGAGGGGGHHVTVPPCHHVIMSPCHHVTMSRSPDSSGLPGDVM